MGQIVSQVLSQGLKKVVTNIALLSIYYFRKIKEHLSMTLSKINIQDVKIKYSILNRLCLGEPARYIYSCQRIFGDPFWQINMKKKNIL